MASSSISAAFETALANFKADLKKRDRDNFKDVTLEDLLKEVDELQTRQHAQRRGQNLARLKPFLEAMDQFGKVVEVFCEVSEIVAFVWGPMKFLLQIASSFAEAFHGLLNIYAEIGENLPLLQQYGTLFQDDSMMAKIMVSTYEDVLEFHRRALKYFQQPMLKQLFQATWKTYKSRFSPLIDAIRGHARLIEMKATLSQIEDFRKARDLHESQLQSILEAEQSRRLRDLYVWLRSTNVEDDHSLYCKIRAEFPGTGQWLLDNKIFKEWFIPKFPIIPPLLWLNGIPGAGKTILASLVIEEAKRLPSCPVVLYFYCKNQDMERDNFCAVGRTFLARLLNNNKDILQTYYYDAFSNSTQAVLSTQSTIEQLLDVAIRNCPDVYIILDGIDECERDERKKITQWFCNLVQDLPSSKPDRVRCLFLSQDDGFARKDFIGLTTLKIECSHIESDIKEYSSVWASRIQTKFLVTDSTRTEIATKVSKAANGMFLLARLIMANLYHQTSIHELKGELEHDRIPKEINEAYFRIISRIFSQASAAEELSTKWLFCWLVCAKRPLRWYEIQAARSIDIESQLVDLEQRSFRVNSKEMCGSLVEIRDDGTVELVHSTAKFFLTTQGYVDAPVGEIKLTSLCIDYLKMPGFHGNTDEISLLVPKGYYGFMEYAVSNWVRHLEDIIGDTRERTSELHDLSESLDVFLDLHYKAHAKKYPVSKGNTQRIKFFEDQPYFHRLQQAVISTRKELTFYGQMKETETATDLTSVVAEIRKVIENLYTSETSQSERTKLERMYGSNLFKCSRLSCRYFYNGFPTADQRNQHVDKHLRPYRCAVMGCPYSAFGFISAKELENHERKTHSLHQEGDDDFPGEEDGSGTRRSDTKETNNLTPRSKSTRKYRAIQPKRAIDLEEPTELCCPHCRKTFTKRHNLMLHLDTHKK